MRNGRAGTHSDGPRGGSEAAADWADYGWWQLLKDDLRRKRHIDRMMAVAGPGFFRRCADQPRGEPLGLREGLSFLLQPPTVAIALYRLSHSASRRGRKVSMRILHWMGVALTGADISPLAEIGPGLFMGHSVGTTIGIIRAGRNLTLLGQAGIGGGGADNPALDGHPTIGDDVWFFYRALAFGPIRIGSNSFISAGSIVLHPVPAGTLVRGNPARVVRRRNVSAADEVATGVQRT